MLVGIAADNSLNGRKGAGYEKKYRNSRIGSLVVGNDGLGSELLAFAGAAQAEWLFELDAECSWPISGSLSDNSECTPILRAG